jgi:hypothetical protein
MNARPKTRQELAGDIYDKIERLQAALSYVPGEKWSELIGEEALQETGKGWVHAILDGMRSGTITVGDPRLADMLHKIEQSVMATIGDREETKTKFAQLQHPNAKITLNEFWEAVLGIERITADAIQAGLTTPGQDLFALPRRTASQSI